MSPLLLNLHQMNNLALATPEIGNLNLPILHAMLQIIITKLNLDTYRVEWDGENGMKISDKIKNINLKPIVEITEYKITDSKDLDKREVIDRENVENELQKIITINPLSCPLATPLGLPITPLEIKSLKSVINADESPENDVITKILPKNSELLKDIADNQLDTNHCAITKMWNLLNLTKRLDAVEISLKKMAGMLNSMDSKVKQLNEFFETSDGGIDGVFEKINNLKPCLCYNLNGISNFQDPNKDGATSFKSDAVSSVKSKSSLKSKSSTKSKSSKNSSDRVLVIDNMNDDKNSNNIIINNNDNNDNKDSNDNNNNNSSKNSIINNNTNGNNNSSNINNSNKNDNNDNDKNNNNNNNNNKNNNNNDNGDNINNNSNNKIENNASDKDTENGNKNNDVSDNKDETDNKINSSSNVNDNNENKNNSKNDTEDNNVSDNNDKNGNGENNNIIDNNNENNYNNNDSNNISDNNENNDNNKNDDSKINNNENQSKTSIIKTDESKGSTINPPNINAQDNLRPDDGTSDECVICDCAKMIDLDTLNTDISNKFHDKLNEKQTELKQLIDTNKQENTNKWVEFEKTFLSTLLEIQNMMDAKLDKKSVPELKEFITNKFNEISDEIIYMKKVLHPIPQSAGTTIKLLKDLECLSCNRLTSQLNEENPPYIPKMYPALPQKVLKSKQRHTTPVSTSIEDNCQDSIVQHDKQNVNIPANDTRYCGGKHTITTAKERIGVQGNFIRDHGINCGSGGVPLMVQGTDGKMYRGANTLCTCNETDKNIIYKKTSDNNVTNK